MEKKNKLALSLLGVFLIGILGFSMISAFGMPFMSEEDKDTLEAQKEEMKTAIENKDFATWKNLMEQRLELMKNSITEENFNKLTEMHEQKEAFKAELEALKESGDFSKEEVEALREKYGIQGNGFGKANRGEHKGMGMHEGIGQGMEMGNGMKLGLEMHEDLD